MSRTSSTPLEHYVPQFYLRRFADASGRLWVWDREENRVFRAKPRAVAAERAFYYLDELAAEGHDPLAMEQQFSSLEYEVARITDQWIEWISNADSGSAIPIPDPNRDLVSLFLTLQFLRTADSRDVLARVTEARSNEPMDERERRALHTQALWTPDLVEGMQKRIRETTWVFGRNDTEVPFMTSDNPVAFRSPDSRMWMKARMLGAGAYVVYPLAPEVVMYCYPKEEPWLGVVALDGCVSPVPFTAEMIESENSGQVFMASRFVISCRNEFAAARAFAKTIGTDIYAPQAAPRLTLASEPRRNT